MLVLGRHIGESILIGGRDGATVVDLTAEEIGNLADATSGSPWIEPVVQKIIDAFNRRKPVTVTVVAVRSGGLVRLGIDADKSVRVDRKEVAEKV